MLRMLIVDDFFYDMEDAKTIINWNALGITITGTVTNGHEALSLIGTEQIDILLTDIDMPEMNGLELIREVKNNFSSTTVVIMSCYSDFKYAKEALLLDVAAYITKPLTSNETLSVFEPLVNKINDEKRALLEQQELKRKIAESMPVMKERFLRNLFLGVRMNIDSVTAQFDYFKLYLHQGYYRLLIFEMDDCEETPDALFIEQQQSKLFILESIIKHKLESYGCNWENSVLIQIDDTHIALLISKLSEELAKSPALGRLAECIHKKLRTADFPSMTMVLGKSFGNIWDLHSHYVCCADAMKHKFFVGKGQLLDASEIVEEDESKTIHLDELKQRLKNVIFSESDDEVQAFMEEYYPDSSKPFPEHTVKDLTFSIVICIQLLLTEYNLKQEDVFSEDMIVWKKLLNFDTILDVKQWIKNILLSVRYIIIENKKHKNRKLVNDVIAFLKQNYQQEITIQKVADIFYFSPNYLNSLFTNETGRTIPDYITHLRIEKAKELLADSELKLYEVADKVCYKHLPYFNKLFKQYTGMTLKEYRSGI